MCTLQLFAYKHDVSQMSKLKFLDAYAVFYTIKQIKLQWLFAEVCGKNKTTY
jgi:hypothetical protein